MNKKELLINEYNERCLSARCQRMDEHWFRDTMNELSDGILSCFGQGHHLIQETDCEWDVLYGFLSKLLYDSAKIKVYVKPEDFANITDSYSKIEEAKKRGWIRLDAYHSQDGTIKLIGYLEADYGDSDGFGMEVTNLYAVLNEKGDFVVPFLDYIP